MMCRDHTSQDAVNKGWSAWDLRTVGLTNAMPQLSVLSPIRIVMALEARERELWHGVPHVGILNDCTDAPVQVHTVGLSDVDQPSQTRFMAWYICSSVSWFSMLVRTNTFCSSRG